MSGAVLGLEVTPALLALGAITGMTYGILAVGLVLVYRSTRVINFAHGEVGAFGAAVCGVLVVRWHAPYWVAFVAAVVVSASIGALTELTVVRRLRHAPRLMMLVATLGVAQFLLALSSVVNSQARAGSTFPQPDGLPEFSIGVLRVTPAYTAMLLTSPFVVAALVLFLRRTRYGLALRASASNAERARLVAISAGRMSTLAWAVAGAVAAFTTVLIVPTRGFITAETLGPVLLLRAIAPAVIGRMASLPVAFVAGIGVGVADQILIFNYPDSGISEVVLLAVLAVALLAQSRRQGRLEEKEDWSLLQPWPSTPEALRRVWAIRNLGWIVGCAAIILAIGIGAIASNAAAVTLVAVIAFSLIGLSLGIVTGLAGQLSLGQFAIAGVGATVSYAVTTRFGPWSFLFALAYAAFAGAAVSTLLGLPALRVRGLLLGVITLSFALASQRWILSQTWALGGGAAPIRPDFGVISFQATRSYYFWALGVLVIGVLVSRNVWRGAVGLRLRAVRDNEQGARAFGLSAAAVKLQGFALSGVLAGLGGAVYGHLLSRISSESFDVVTSINAVALSVLGGIGLLAGPILGALYIIGLPRFLPLDNAGLAATALGWLLLILYFPGGVAQVVAAPRTRLLKWLARNHETSTEEATHQDERKALGGDIRLRRDTASTPGHGVVLQGTGLVKHYGGVHAVDGVTLTLDRGEILGLMGPNGAGKTTVFELLSGFACPDAGTVHLGGQDVTNLLPEQRARLGLIRSFQDAALFPTLTVLETVTLACERLSPTNGVLSSAGLQRSERAHRAMASDVVAMMGLDTYRERQVRELSTGTRRIAELACIVALQPTVLLLDEPSSGIAQSESEALGEVITRLRDHLSCSIVLIEHDIPLLMALSSRIIAMDTGRVIAAGSPAAVRADPAVITAYLGSNATAIERSGRSPVVTGSM